MPDTRWTRTEAPAPPQLTAATQPALATSLLPPGHQYPEGKRPRGRPAKATSAVADNEQRITSFAIHGTLFKRLKEFLAENKLSQSEYIELLVRNDLALRGR